MTITALSQQVCQHIEEIERKENMLSQAKAIKETHEILKKVETDARQFASLLLIYHDCLSPDERQKFIANALRLRTKLHESADKFESEPRQKGQLTQIDTQLQSLEREVEQAWQVYAERKAASAFDLLKLILHLPEVQTQKTYLIALQARITRSITFPPQTEADLQNYEQSLQELLAYLNSIDGLSREVSTFLLKVLNGEATVADLTDEVLHWCWQGERATAFAISFTH